MIRDSRQRGEDGFARSCALCVALLNVVGVIVDLSLFAFAFFFVCNIHSVPSFLFHLLSLPWIKL